MSLQEVSEILGHSNISMTMRYAHLESTVTAKKARDLLNRLNDTKPVLKVV
jgi:integrase